MKKIWLIFLLIVPGLTHAQSCRPITLDEVGKLFSTVISKYAPSLEEKKIPLHVYHSEGYFLQATVLKKPLLRGRKSYRLEVGQRLLDCPPDQSALTAIILHETQHFLDYEGLSAFHVAVLGKNYVLSKKFRIHYERATDLKVLEHMEGTGLMAYRLWLYDQLTPKQLEVKNATYFTPEEIVEWMALHPTL
jgi:hypothetical protein